MDPPSAVVGDAAPPPVYRIGTLAYTRAGLRRVFLWLLAGDVMFTLIDQIEWKIIPVVLKQYGASDSQIAIIIGSITSLMVFLVSPIVCYRSDRKRTKWGRRIPYLLWAAPMTALFLAATPFAPEIAACAQAMPVLAPLLESCGWAPALVMFLILAVGYRGFHAVLSPMFFCLFRDVVPGSHMGRFLALFRVVGALTTFAVTYFLLGLTETHPKLVFIGVAVVGVVGFLAMCLFVREGEYPPVVDKVGAATVRVPLLRAVLNFAAESYTHPIYLWTYLTRVLIYGASTISGFLVFFPQRELGLTLDQSGKLMSWPALAWLALAYPVGRSVDKWGAMRVLSLALATAALGYGVSFFLVVGPITFFVSTLVTGVAFWAIMMTQIALAQEMFHPQRYGQLGSANALVQSLAIALVLSPVAGWILDSLQGMKASFVLPGLGTVAIGPYRFVNLMLGTLYVAAWFSLIQVRRLWRAHGGPGAYVAPL